MAMTRKHFKALAECLLESRESARRRFTEDELPAVLSSISDLEESMIEMMKKENPRFDVERFLAAATPEGV